MSTLLYYIPGGTLNVPDVMLRERGLGRIFDHPYISKRQCNRGPGPNANVAGVILADERRLGEQPSGYYPDHQEWQKMPGHDVWVGIDTRHVPTPEDLVRDEPLRGHPIELADGKTWIVPVAIQFTDLGEEALVPIGALPRRLRLDDDGNWYQGDVLAKYTELWDLANEWYNERLAASLYVAANGGSDAGYRSERYTTQWIIATACRVLGFNYVIEAAGISLLGLFSTGAPTEVLHLLLDQPGIDALIEARTTQKKTDDLSATAAGSTDEHAEHSPTSGSK